MSVSLTLLFFQLILSSSIIVSVHGTAAASSDVDDFYYEGVVNYVSLPPNNSTDSRYHASPHLLYADYDRNIAWYVAKHYTKGEILYRLDHYHHHDDEDGMGTGTMMTTWIPWTSDGEPILEDTEEEESAAEGSGTSTTGNTQLLVEQPNYIIPFFKRRTTTTTPTTTTTTTSTLDSSTKQLQQRSQQVLLVVGRTKIYVIDPDADTDDASTNNNRIRIISDQVGFHNYPEGTIAGDYEKGVVMYASNDDSYDKDDYNDYNNDGGIVYFLATNVSQPSYGLFVTDGNIVMPTNMIFKYRSNRLYRRLIPLQRSTPVVANNTTMLYNIGHFLMLQDDPNLSRNSGVGGTPRRLLHVRAAIVTTTYNDDGGQNNSEFSLINCQINLLWSVVQSSSFQTLNVGSSVPVEVFGDNTLVFRAVASTADYNDPPQLYSYAYSRFCQEYATMPCSHDDEVPYSGGPIRDDIDPCIWANKVIQDTNYNQDRYIDYLLANFNETLLFWTSEGQYDSEKTLWSLDVLYGIPQQLYTGVLPFFRSYIPFADKLFFFGYIFEEDNEVTVYSIDDKGLEIAAYVRNVHQARGFTPCSQNEALCFVEGDYNMTLQIIKRKKNRKFNGSSSGSTCPIQNKYAVKELQIQWPNNISSLWNFGRSNTLAFGDALYFSGNHGREYSIVREQLLQLTIARIPVDNSNSTNIFIDDDTMCKDPPPAFIPPGNIFTDVVWSLETTGPLVEIHESLYILEEGSLTILPGVHVEFIEKSASIFIRGTVVVNGNSTHMVSLHGGYEGFAIMDAAADNATLSVQYATFSDFSRGGIMRDSRSSPPVPIIVDNCLFRDNGYGVRSYGVMMTNCVVTGGRIGASLQSSMISHVSVLNTEHIGLFAGTNSNITHANVSQCGDYNDREAKGIYSNGIVEHSIVSDCHPVGVVLAGSTATNVSVYGSSTGFAGVAESFWGDLTQYSSTMEHCKVVNSSEYGLYYVMETVDSVIQNSDGVGSVGSGTISGTIISGTNIGVKTGCISSGCDEASVNVTNSYICGSRTSSFDAMDYFGRSYASLTEFGPTADTSDDLIESLHALPFYPRAKGFLILQEEEEGNEDSLPKIADHVWAISEVSVEDVCKYSSFASDQDSHSPTSAVDNIMSLDDGAETDVLLIPPLPAPLFDVESENVDSSAKHLVVYSRLSFWAFLSMSTCTILVDIV